MPQPEINIRTEWDRVIVCVRGARATGEIVMPYAQAFQVAQGARLGVKGAKLMARDGSNWRDYVEIREMIPVATVHNEQRSTRLDGKFEWSVKLFDLDERVFLTFGNYELAMHYTKAATFAEELRSQAKIAKAWAGDTGRKMHAMGMLSDAARNEKAGRLVI